MRELVSQADLGSVVRARFPPGPLRAVEQQRRFRATPSDLAVHLLNARPERLDQTLQDSLESLTRSLGVDRTGIIQLADGAPSLLWTHGFAMPGIPTGPTQDFLSLLPWYTEQVRQGHTLVLHCLPEVAGKGNAAERLGMKRGTLQFRVKKLGICRSEAGVST